MPPLRHDGMRFPEERFANHSHLRALPQGSERSSQTRAAGADDQHIVFVGLILGGHKSLKSVIAPLATSRT
jgi:chemotaxis response regulator CheB